MNQTLSIISFTEIGHIAGVLYKIAINYIGVHNKGIVERFSEEFIKLSPVLCPEIFDHILMTTDRKHTVCMDMERHL